MNLGGIPSARNAQLLGHFCGLVDADVLDQLHKDGIHRFHGRCTQIQRARTLAIGGVVDHARVGFGRLAPGDHIGIPARIRLGGLYPLGERSSEGERFEGRPGLASAATTEDGRPAEAGRGHDDLVILRIRATSEGEVHLATLRVVEIPAADERLHISGGRLDGGNRHVEAWIGLVESGGDGGLGRFLEGRIERGDHLESALVDDILTVGGDQCAAHVVDEIRILRDRLLLGPHDGRSRTCREWAGNGEVQFLAESALVVGLGDPVLVEHLPQHEQPLRFSPRHVLSRRVPGGRRDKAGEGGGLRQRQILHRLAEVGLGGGADPVRAVAQVDDREVAVEDLVLVLDLAVELAGQHCLADLAGERALLADIGVLHVLLGDGGAALLHPTAAHVGHECPDRAPDIYATMLVKATVFGGDDGVFHYVGDVGFGEGDRLLELAKQRNLVVVHIVDMGELARHGCPRRRQRRRQREEQKPGEHRTGDRYRGDDGTKGEQAQCPEDSANEAEDRTIFPWQDLLRQAGRRSRTRVSEEVAPALAPKDPPELEAWKVGAGHEGARALEFTENRLPRTFRHRRVDVGHRIEVGLGELQRAFDGVTQQHRPIRT